MAITKENYKIIAKAKTPPAKKIGNMIKAFIVGGLICVIGELLNHIYINAGFSSEEVAMLVALTLIGAAAALTALKLYNNFGNFAGAGALIPITGFSNAISSTAIEYKSEGLILGVGSKMFIIAGPVILYGEIASIVYGLIICIFVI